MQSLIASFSAAIPVLLGGLLTGMFALAAAIINSRTITRVDKSSRKKEILIALETEISEYAKQSDTFDPEDLLYGFSIKLQNDADYEFFLPSELNNIVYKSLSQNLHVLPEEVISSVVRFHNVIYSIEAIMNVINHPTYTKRDIAEKIELYYEYLKLKTTALEVAEKALKKIKKAKI